MDGKEGMRDLIERYKKKIEREVGETVETQTKGVITREYQEFKKEYLPEHLTLYEKLCNYSEKLIKVTPDKKKAEELRESIDVCHLNITPTGATSFAMVAPFILILLSATVSIALFGSFFVVFFFIILGISLIKPLGKIPMFIANSWRLKASNQMVLCVFYVVTYMRHTSNLELAIKFASDHIDAPLSLDFKRIIWNVETEKCSNMKESLDDYLQTWRKWNMEFIEAFHLIESSLYEGEEKTRIAALDKSLDVILTETYERMLHYAQNLKSPITMLHMLGVILPILGLVILPLVVSFMTDFKWQYIALIYNIVLPVTVYYMGKTILAKRPTGYGNTDISELPEFKKYSGILFKIGGKEHRISPLHISIMIALLFFIVGISPIVLHWFIEDETGLGWNLGQPSDETSACFKAFCLLDYRTSDTGKVTGPFGLGASMLSLFVIISVGFSWGYYFKLRSKNVIKIRRKIEELEREFASGLFQLGNRLGDGLPAETAFGRVGRSMEGTASGSFFQLVSMNIRRLGMGVTEAIFNPRNGALVYFPSNLIESSMKVLIESVKKGPKVAAAALMNISRYVKEIHKVNERLKDLMAEVISSMNSQIKFLTPVIAGIVIGITSMVTTILGKLSVQMKQMSGGGGAGMLEGGLFGQGVPTYYFQIVVGLYVVQITYILTILSNGIENGADKLNERYLLGQNLVRSTLLYCFISATIMLIFNFIANKIMMVSAIG